MPYKNYPCTSHIIEDINPITPGISDQLLPQGHKKTIFSILGPLLLTHGNIIDQFRGSSVIIKRKENLGYTNNFLSKNSQCEQFFKTLLLFPPRG